MGGVFIGGMDRSGTTLVQSMLNAHPSILVTYESRLPLSLHGRFARVTPAELPDFIDAIRSHEFFSGISADAICSGLVRESPSFADVIRSAYEALAASQGKSVWGDKCPDYAKHFGYLAEQFPKSRLVHVYRDPRAVAYSLIPKPWGPRTALHAAYEYAQTVSAALLAIRRIGPGRTFTVCYESLVSNPEQVVGQLCSFLGIEPHPAMFDGSNRARGVPEAVKDIHSVVGQEIQTAHTQKWRALPMRDIETIEAVCSDLMEELGYEQITGTGQRNVSLESRLLYGIQRRWRIIRHRHRPRHSTP